MKAGKNHLLTLLVTFVILCQSNSAQVNDPIAILEFDNNSGIEEYNWLSGGIPEILTSKLSNVPDLVVIERRQIKKTLSDVAFTQTGLVDPEKAVTVGKMLGADIVILGSFQIIGKSILITSRVIDVETSKISGSKNVRGSLDKIFDLEFELAEQLIEELGIKITSNTREIIRSAGTDYLRSQALIAEAERISTELYELANWDQIQQTLDLIDEALKYNPTNYQALRWGGIVFKNAKFYEKSIELLEKALEQTPNDQLIRSSLVKPYIETGSYDKAIEFQIALLNEGYQTDESDPAFIIEAYFRKGDLNNCHLWINKLRGHSEYLDTFIDMFDKRIDDIEKGVSSIEAYILMQKAYGFEFTAQDSLHHYIDLAIETSPKDGNLYFAKAFAYGSNNIRGIPYYEKAMECGNLSPDDVSTAYYNIGYIYSRQGDWNSAKVNFQKAVDNSSGKVLFMQVRNLYDLAYANYELGKINEAYEQLREVLTMDPDYEEAQLLFNKIEFQKSLMDKQQQKSDVKIFLRLGLTIACSSFIGAAVAILVFL